MSSRVTGAPASFCYLYYPWARDVGARLTRGLGAFLARRLAALVATLLATSFIVYGAVYLAPGSPLDAVTGGRPLPPSTLKAISHSTGSTSRSSSATGTG